MAAEGEAESATMVTLEAKVKVVSEDAAEVVMEVEARLM